MVLVAILAAAVQGLAPYDLPPINYSASVPNDPVARLQSRLDADETKLAFDEKSGYLKAFLEALGIPASSQTLVFSKTSLQRTRIDPWTPRALYFNDDTYVGWVKDGDVLEISSVDPQLGAVFYTLDQVKAFRPRFRRQIHRCLQCHDSGSQTLGVPGHIVRSVFPGGDGQPILREGTYRTSDRSPFEERWGGWYVTGETGSIRHMGNKVYRSERIPEFRTFANLGSNKALLARRVSVESYLAPTSDVVALMVLKHQTVIHNLLTRANHQTRIAALHGAEMNKLSGDPPGTLTPGTRSRIRAYCDPLVEALFFSGETALPGPVQGDSTFTRDFEKRGPVDGRGRSLRHFDLERRMFKYPLSFLVYSNAFKELPPHAWRYVLGRMKEILLGRDTSEPFSHLSAEDRRVVLEILRATKPNWVADWK